MTKFEQPRAGTSRRSVLRALAGGAFAAGGLGTMPHAVAASGYPSEPLTLVVPWPPGGPNDVVMRAVATQAAKFYGQPIVIVNKPGAGGTLGASTMAATARPDGSTICQFMVSALRMPHIEKVSYDPLKDFTFIIGLGGSSTGIIVRADAPWKSLQDMLADAKAKPRTISYASTGQGTTLHLAMEDMARQAGVQLLHVPYRGTADTTLALMGGQVTMQLDTVGVPMVRSGKARVLATFTEERDAKVPQVPTLRELGINVVAQSPYGLAGPKGMDPAVVKVLHDTFKKALETPEVKSVIEENSQIVWYRTGDEYRRWAEQQYEVEGRNVKAIGMARAA